MLFMALAGVGVFAAAAVWVYDARGSGILGAPSAGHSVAASSERTRLLPSDQLASHTHTAHAV